MEREWNTKFYDPISNFSRQERFSKQAQYYDRYIAIGQDVLFTIIPIKMHKIHKIYLGKNNHV